MKKFTYREGIHYLITDDAVIEVHNQFVSIWKADSYCYRGEREDALKGEEISPEEFEEKLDAVCQKAKSFTSIAA